ncbi:MAG: HAD-IA family hydrolase [Clostridia bacterium]|nr:HAD-IA family hydrolase [Clostridia bacterium]MBQ8334028.1 HAD-IA family hydrolase [Clostridia bacterium]MBQ8369167.1 HAD-IA family hydrolase [Clostridia bacterium]
MKYKNYIWDFDGTLFDSYPHICECLLQILEREGIRDNFDAEMVMRYLCVSYGAARDYTGITKEAYRDFVDLQYVTGENEVEPKVVPYDDCEKVLREIMLCGGRHFLYTHRNMTAVEHIANFGMSDCFVDRVTSEDKFPSKPAPNAIQALIDRNQLDPAETIMIGDREIDGKSGKNAGIDGALVNYYPRLPDGTSPADVSEMDYVAGSLTELWEMLRNAE